ncbi:DUF4153 domain-containing protein [Acidaminobacter hydrogenoformans]|uniref:DUF4153 domain-containing protein n=1 Tax=Acidaminobacter hydrogenoformans DSM 2784 TaxID=1120920 RepID=A0A1G5S635_9FIRM|nr:DUF4153 domain-containing protein [Acidaminobacter hydrogenoformans]SCZ81783.1 protein of unknown function [Acidaminobacter hydrogenoformans DSM 2784]
MNAFTRSISKVFKGAFGAFQAYPASIASAVGFAIVTMVRIQLDWPEQEAYNFLFNCLHLAFAVGAIFSLMTVTAARSKYNTEKAFLAANLLGAAAVVVTFLLLYFFGGSAPDRFADMIVRVSGLSAARVTVVIFISLMGFIVLASKPEEQSDFSRALLMTHKAFFIAAIYGAVMMSGTSAVAGAIQALLYRQMSYKVYQYLGTLVGFLTFTIFVGYFPDFRKGAVDERRETLQKQPRFIEVLFEFIMIPIALALTVVLLLWTGKTLMAGQGASFMQLSGIATSYAVGGTWLHIMVTHNTSSLAKFYRKVYPFAALLILAFEAWALIVQLGRYGMKTAEYAFLLVWIVAVAAAVLLILKKEKAHVLIVALICGAAVLSVLPVMGYHSVPVRAQLSRLEGLLVSENLLQEDQLVPAAQEPERPVREAITDAVTYLAYVEGAKLPVWFDEKLAQPAQFKAQLGFEQIWPEPEDIYGDYPQEVMNVALMLENGAFEIEDYRWAIRLQNYEGKYGGAATTEVEGERGTYEIDWITDQMSGMPTLEIRLNDQIILEESMRGYFDRISESYDLGQRNYNEATFEEMSHKLESDEVEVLLVFENVDFSVNVKEDAMRYWINLDVLYMREK